MSENLSYYELFNVSESASVEEIKSAYRRSMTVCHPDKHANDVARNHAEHLALLHNRAHETLMNAARRSDYDRRCGENERLAAKLRHLHAALAELRSEAVVLRSENAQLRSEGAQLRTESETLRAHRAQLRSDIAQLRTETAAMRERVGQLEFALNDRASTAVAGQVTGTSVESNVVLGSGQSGIRVTGRVWLTNLAGVRVCAQARFFWQDTDQYVPARGGGDLLASATERVIDYTSVNLTFVLDFPYAAFPSIAPGTHALQGHIFIWREHEGTWPLLATALTSGFRVYAQ